MGVTRESVDEDVRRARERGDHAGARHLDKYGSLAIMLQKWAAKAHKNYVSIWLSSSNLGAGVPGKYVVVERGVGYAVAELPDGDRRVLHAPVPLA